MPYGIHGLSRRGFLATIPLAALALTVACQHEPEKKSRAFGLASTGLDDGAVARSKSAVGQLDRQLDVLVVYDSFVWDKPLPTALLDATAVAGGIPQITWEPWDPRAGKHQAAYTAAEIAGGRYDGYVRGWAQQAASYGRPFQIRFAHEMNGDWYPWAVGAPGGTPQDYVAAFRRVRGIFDDAGADGVDWVWCPNVIVNGNTDAITQCYPGDDVVDIVGVDGYNFGNRPNHTWTEPAELFSATVDLLRRLAPGKPLWINEVGCGDQGGDKARWIADFVGWLGTTEVGALVWFEVDGRPENPDWRLTSTPAVLDAAKAALASW